MRRCRALLMAIRTEHEQKARHMRSLVKHMVLTTVHSVFPPLKGPRFGSLGCRFVDAVKLISTVQEQNSCWSTCTSHDIDCSDYGMLKSRDTN